MIVLDTSGLLAALVGSQPEHGAVAGVFATEQPPYLLSPFVLAEVDYFLVRWAGIDAELAFLEDVARGAYELETFTESDVDLARRVVVQYRDLGLGLADASVVCLAERHRTDRILTLDERHFRPVRPARGAAFTLLPADAV
ncbi:MAG: PIN domain-containing protein [Thermoleophilia bacterium]|nr:PIN domain-containing protein [Thermoleophilia bacterium]